MRPRRMSQVARAVDGLHTGADVEVSSVVTDSRAAGPGALFVALPGEHTDGGLFVPEAFDNGAAGALLRDGLSATGPAVFVRSPGDAFLQLAADERRTMSARVVGITGANGKTSTKDMAAAVCARRLRTHASPESFNNEVGLPVTLLGAAADAEVVVAEMGARRKGDVTLLCEIARPDIVVVTNVGVAHLEIFGSWEAIVEASAEPVDAIGADGVAVLNADDPVVAGFAGRSAGRVVTFGTTPNADVRAEDVTLDPDGLASFTLVHGQDRVAVRLAVAGAHMVSNALAAAAVGLQVGVSLQDARDRPGRRPRVALAHGDLHHRRGDPRRERRLQRQPRVGDRRAQDGTVDGRRRAPDRRPRHHGRTRPDHRRGARARRRTRGPAPRRPVDHRGRGRVGHRDGGRSAKGWSPVRRPPTTTPPRRSPTSASTRGPATSCCSRPPASRAWKPWRRRCGEIDPRGRRRRPRRDVAGHAHRDPGLPRLGMGSAHPRGRSAHPLREDGHAHDGRHRDADRAWRSATPPPGSRRDGPPRAGSRWCSPPPGSALVGFADDFTKVRRRRSLGLSKSQKFLGTAVVSVLFGVIVAHYSDSSGTTTNLSFVRDTGVHLGVFFLLWCFLMLTASSNAVNLTDGLDGLAAGSTTLVLRPTSSSPSGSSVIRAAAWGCPTSAATR